MPVGVGSEVCAPDQLVRSDGYVAERPPDAWSEHSSHRWQCHSDWPRRNTQNRDAPARFLCALLHSATSSSSESSSTPMRARAAMNSSLSVMPSILRRRSSCGAGRGGAGRTERVTPGQRGRQPRPRQCGGASCPGARSHALQGEVVAPRGHAQALVPEHARLRLAVQEEHRGGDDLDRELLDEEGRLGGVDGQELGRRQQLRRVPHVLQHHVAPFLELAVGEHTHRHLGARHRGQELVLRDLPALARGPGRGLLAPPERRQPCGTNPGEVIVAVIVLLVVGGRWVGVRGGAGGLRRAARRARRRCTGARRKVHPKALLLCCLLD